MDNDGGSVATMPKNSKGALRNCPELEQLAAFVDGTLHGSDRASVIAHLAGCERCYVALVETIHLQNAIDRDQTVSQASRT